MNELEDLHDTRAPTREDKINVLLARTSTAGIEVEKRELEHVPADRARESFVLHMPNGRRKRKHVLFPKGLDVFLETDFEHHVFLGDYQVFVDTRTGDIECQVTGAGPVSRVMVGNALQRIPGVEVYPSAKKKNPLT